MNLCAQFQAIIRLFMSTSVSIFTDDCFYHCLAHSNEVVLVMQPLIPHLQIKITNLPVIFISTINHGVVCVRYYCN